MSICHIAKSIARGRVTAPPSKSYAHRLLLAAFLSGKRTVIDNIDLSKDILATIGCIRALGGEVNTEVNKAIISGKEADTNSDHPGEVLPCAESGSTLRFMIPVALALRGCAVFTGTAKLFSRGIGEYEKIFASQGINYEIGEGFIKVRGELRSGTFTIDGTTSSQYITGLLFTLPLLNGESKIIITLPVQSRPYIEITLDVLRNAGITAGFNGNELTIPGGQHYNLPDCRVEGDWSNAAFLEFFNHIGGDVTVEGLNPDSLQGDKIYRQHFNSLDSGFCTIDIGNCIDLGPVLFTMAAIKHGARFVNTARLRIKESDRIADIISELEKIGSHTVTDSNSVVIEPAPQATLKALEGRGITFSSHNDHRLAMSLTALASIFGGSIEGCEAVAKSFPRFFEQIKGLNIGVYHE
ncbi:MAG: 3-phosphoshikimate 1-carboxyvinyltransferase [Bacteroidales bacterium]|nr:3-phosphoshikimate 1-carboxyvinyltransferase [Bacteroidales bacterium]